jgi:hypothetical protein
MMSLVIVPTLVTFHPAATNRLSAPAARPLVVVLFSTTSGIDFGETFGPGVPAERDDEEPARGELLWAEDGWDEVGFTDGADDLEPVADEEAWLDGWPPELVGEVLVEEWPDDFGESEPPSCTAITAKMATSTPSTMTIDPAMRSRRCEGEVTARPDQTSIPSRRAERWR